MTVIDAIGIEPSVFAGHPRTPSKLSKILFEKDVEDALLETESSMGTLSGRKSV